MQSARRPAKKVFDPIVQVHPSAQEPKKMETLSREMTRDTSGWAPHYNDVQEHVSFKTGQRVRLVRKEYEGWAHMPGHGHHYYLLEYATKSGERRFAWIRTYHFQDENNFSRELPGEVQSAPGR